MSYKFFFKLLIIPFTLTNQNQELGK